MGRIRPTYIKRVSLELISRYPQAFNRDFDNNKQMVSQLADVSTASMRNKVAGYVTRYMSRPEA
ncbi:30S ribosomal protein S17e [Methanomassiliicoccaceae archaeon COG_1]|nr:30S ribosomal protein S17e [Methanomassiliicoccaceae archaeon COG_1]